MLAFPQFKKLKRRASLEFCVDLDDSDRNRSKFKIQNSVQNSQTPFCKTDDSDLTHI